MGASSGLLFAAVFAFCESHDRTEGFVSSEGVVVGGEEEEGGFEDSPPAVWMSWRNSSSCVSAGSFGVEACCAVGASSDGAVGCSS